MGKSFLMIEGKKLEWEIKICKDKKIHMFQFINQEANN